MFELYLSYLVILVLLIIVIYQFFDNNKKYHQESQESQKNNENNNKEVIYTDSEPISSISPVPNPAQIVNVYNKMRNYDYRVYDDPLTPPEKRDDADLPPQLINPELYNIYTNGGPGIYKKFGYVKTDAEEINDKYRFMNLIGRQKYEGSNQYQYYLVSTNRNDNIKINLPQVKRELSTGDVIKVPQLTKDGSYDVHIDKNIDYQYSPIVY
jgi:hypothetical protein